MNHGNVSREITRGPLALQKCIEMVQIPSAKIETTINLAYWGIRRFRKKPHDLAHWFVGWGLLMLALTARLPAEPTQVKSRGLSDRSTIVMGELGLPLGTPVEVEGVIVSVKNPYSHLYTVGVDVFYYRLAVDTIGGRKLASTITFDFNVENPLGSLMAQIEPELKKLLGSSVEGDCSPDYIISREQADQYLRDYTKTRRKILVYESGRYSGRPRSLPQTKPVTDAPDYHFDTFLVVVEPEKPIAASLRQATRPGVTGQVQRDPS